MSPKSQAKWFWGWAGAGAARVAAGAALGGQDKPGAMLQPGRTIPSARPSPETLAVSYHLPLSSKKSGCQDPASLCTPGKSFHPSLRRRKQSKEKGRELSEMVLSDVRFRIEQIISAHIQLSSRNLKQQLILL